MFLACSHLKLALDGSVQERNLGVCFIPSLPAYSFAGLTGSSPDIREAP